MKNFNLLSKLCGSLVSSQSNDVSFDCRLTVGSPSGLDAKWMLKLVSVLVLILTVGVGQIWGANAPVNTVLWSENFAHFGTSKPSTAGTNTGTGGGTKIYDGASISYSESSTSTKAYSEKLAGGTSPELLLAKGNTTWTISGIKTGNASVMTLTFKSNYASYASVSTSESTKLAVAESSAGTWTISVKDGQTAPATFNLTITNTQGSGKKDKNIRLDDVELKVTTAGGGGGCSNQVNITNSSPTNTTNGSFTLDKTGSQDACSALSVVVTPNPDPHYHVATVSATDPASTGTAGDAVDNRDGTYTITYSANAKGNSTISVTFAEDTHYTVTWMKNGSQHTTTEVYSGEKPTFPSTPPTCDATSTTFIGWTKTAWTGKQNQAYVDGLTTDATKVHTSNSTMSTITANGTVYHAVFAKAGAGGSGNIQLSYTSLGLTTSYESESTKSVSDVDFYCNDIMTGNSGSDGYQKIQFKKSSTGPGYIYNSEILPGNITSIVFGSTTRDMTVNFGNSSDPDGSTETTTCSSSSLTATPTGNYKYFKIINSVDYAAYTGTITINYSDVSYSDYLTTCCTELGSINGSVSWPNPTQAVVTWDKLDDQVSAWALSWSPNTAGSSITSAIADYGLTQKTATVSGLACGTEYTFTLTPTLKSGVCTPASNPTIVETSTKYSITKASVSGGSFTTKISSDAVTSACNGSTISIAATPSTGYTFSSWMITNDDNSDADVTSTLLGANSTTASTSFTMPSHRVTITPSFSCIEPVIGTDPASASYTEGASPSALTVAATLSSGTLTYKWQKSTNSGVSWTDESGTGYNTATYAAANISTSLSANGVQYRCIVGNSEGGCTVTSGVATITVTAASKCVAPTFSVSAGTYNSSQTVTISSSTSGSTIYYTTNGSTPTTSSSHGTEGEASASVTVSSSLTLKAIAYKGGMTTSDVSDAAYVICSTDPSFSTTSSSNITITGARVTCAGITKGTCDIDAYGIVYGTSEHPTGNAQQKGTDASTNVSNYYVDLTGLTAATTYYARPYATVNGKTVYGTEISFTTLHIPEITVSETSRAFGTKKVDGSYEMSFTVSGSYLQSNIGLAISGTNEAMFSVDKTSLTPSTGTVGSTTVTVTYTPSAAGSHSATVSITSTNATTKTVTLSGTGQYEDTYMTAMHEGVDAWEDYATGVTKAGTGYDVPNPGDIEAGDREGTGCEGIHYHFAGWVEETYKASPSGHIVAASGTKDASNKTFWAVWEKEAAGSIPPAEVFSEDFSDCSGTGGNDDSWSGSIASNDLPSSITSTWSITAGKAAKGCAKFGTTNNGGGSAGTPGIDCGSATAATLTFRAGAWNGSSEGTTLYLEGTNCDLSESSVTTVKGSFSSYEIDITNITDDISILFYTSASNNRFFLDDIVVTTAAVISYEDPKVECICSADPVAGTAAVDAEGTFSASSIAVKATGASTGHTDCSYTDYGFVWSSSVSAAADLKLVESTGAAAANCTKLQEGTSGEETSFTGSISGSFTANTPIYFRSYVKNGKADGTYQYSSVVTITPRSVTFNLNGHGSSTPATQFVNNGSKATDPSYSESVTGYIFGGWYKEAGCSNAWTFGTDVVSGESKTLYAKWTPISYSVRFNDNDENYLGTATGSMSNQSFDYDEEKALTTNTFSLAGYDFAGWALTADGDVAYADKASVSNLSSTNSAVVDLYAIWTAKSYDVTLAATDETSSVGEQVVTATYNAAMPTTKKGSGDVAAPSRTGYTFTGWEYSSTTYYDYNASTSTLSSAHVWDQPNSTTTLTPKWSINSYTLRWDLAGGTVSVDGTGAAEGATGTPSSSVVYNSAITVPTVTKAGYNFAGWDVTPASNMPASDVTYTATWTAKTLNSISLAPSSGEVYVGQYADFTVSYDPADYISPGYSLNATPVYVAKESAAPANTKLRLKGGRASGPGASITETVIETVTIKANGDNTKTASVEITVNPLPRVHFVDNIHNESFADVVATISENALVATKTTPTHADVANPSSASSCENTHLHLVGWIRGDWPAYVAYMNGTGDAPSVSDITTAGAGYWFTTGADINVLTYDGKTFYAVWAVEE